jgi:hypothetical protein
MNALILTLAAGPAEPTFWNPTILGILTAICAVGLFCGSAYLLLGTNLGGRLGFLVAAAGLTGFMVLLTTLWWTSGSGGIDPPHGRSPAWEVVDVVPAPPDSEIEAVRDIADRGRAVEAEQLTNLRPAIEAAIVPGQSLHGETPEPRPFATLGFTQTTDFLTDFEGFRSFEEGGGTRNIFWHTPEYAAVQICATAKDARGQVITPPRCDPLQPTQYVIMRHDLGTLRQPVVIYWFMSVILFGLSLVGLNWYEHDARARKRAGLTPVPTPGA